MIKKVAPFLAILALSCESLQVLQEIDPSLAVSESDSGRILFSTLISTQQPDTATCKITFVSTTSNLALAAELSGTGVPRTFAAPAGRYRFDQLRCSDRRKFDLSQLLSHQFTVVAGKTSLVGSLGASFDPKGDQVFLRLTDGRKGAHKEFQEAVKRSRLPVVSAYTQKPVTPSMYAMGGEGSWSFQLLYDPKSVNKGQKPESPSLDPVFECEKTEFEWNPIRLGVLDFSAEYDSGIHRETTQSDTVHLFSDAFINCVRVATTGFKPKVKGRSKVQLSFR